jgi:hypothetical protein
VSLLLLCEVTWLLLELTCVRTGVGLGAGEGTGLATVGLGAGEGTGEDTGEGTGEGAGQALKVQVWESDVLLQALPVRERLWLPLPQDAEQAPQEVHSPQVGQALSVQLCDSDVLVQPSPLRERLSVPLPQVTEQAPQAVHSPQVATVAPPLPPVLQPQAALASNVGCKSIRP